MTRLRWAILAPAVAAGVASEAAAYSASSAYPAYLRPQDWIPDLVVGLVFVVSGLLARPSPAERIGWLLVATGFAWFAGNLGPIAWYWHRGPFVHALLRSRRTGSWSRAAIAAGYLAAVIQPVWQQDLAAVVLATGVLAIARSRPALAFALVLYGGAITRLLVPSGDLAAPARYVYQAVLCAIAVGLAWGARHPDDDEATDRVVELAKTGSGSLRDALAEVLGDPGLRVGYWRDETYEDETGRPLDPPGDRVTTPIDRDGGPFAVLIHDRAVLADPATVAAATAAIRLTSANAALQAEVRAQVAELAASRRRLLVAADAERRRLETRLHEGPVRSLTRLLAALPPGRAAEQLALTLDDLGDLARGLHPRELEDGLAVALTALTTRSPVPVRLSLMTGPLPPEIEAAVYYVCAEALANIAKHAAASAATIAVTRHDRHLLVEIRDDGAGGADTALGTGLRGLRDRVETFGGRLTVDSPPGHGTRLVAEIPLA
jgi:signal transduction histidine kinase